MDNSVDIFLLICLIPAIVNGIRKGFIRQVTAIIAIVLGVWLSYECSGVVSQYVTEWTGVKGDVVKIIAFALIFVACSLGLSLLGHLIDKFLSIILLGWLNKLLGVLFAIAKYILVMGIIFYLFDMINKDGAIISESLLNDSVIYNVIMNVNAAVFPYIQGFINL